jgi:citrate/tricarballylate utilization protein
MAKVRVETYQEYAWPASFGMLYKRAGMAVVLALAFGIGLFLLLVMALNGSLLHQPLAGDFYQIFPHNLLAGMFGSVFVFSLCSLLFSTRKFWREISSVAGSLPALAETTRNVLTLTYLDGGHGEGCNDEDDAFTLRRRRFHHFTFYGFMLCFASTIVATGYHFLLGQEAPYDLLSLPVILGTLGGIGLIIGPAGLLWLNLRRNPAHGDAAQKPMDRGFILLLLLVSITGIALLVGRDTSLMGALLAVHLGAVMALFLTLPYGKFAHGFYRTAALLKWAIEKRRKA